MATFELKVLPGPFAVCRLSADADLPSWATGELVSVTRTPDELSIVCADDGIPDGVKKEADWRCLRVAGSLDFDMVGVLAGLTETLAAASISVFVISTYDTDYLLVKQTTLEAAIESLRSARHLVSS